MIKNKYGNILQIHQAEITVRNIVYLFNGITELPPSIFFIYRLPPKVEAQIRDGPSKL